MEANNCNDMFKVLGVKDKEISNDTHAFLMLMDAFEKIYNEVDTITKDTINAKGLQDESPNLFKAFEIGYNEMYLLLNRMMEHKLKETDGEFI